MIKKTVAVLLGLMLSLSAASAFAQPAAFPPEALELFAKEPPVTQADVDLYLKALPEMPKVMANPEGLTQLYKDLGLTEARFSFIVAKISLAHSLALGATEEQLGMNNIPEVIRPAESDKALVQQNLDELTRVTKEMRSMVAQ